MGFVENKKLAKDINKNTEDCTKQLETLLASLNSQMGLMNSLISSISGGYVSKDYVDNAFNQAAQIKIGSYVGTGTYGKDNPNIISCGFKPKIIKIYSCANTGNNHGNFDCLTEIGTLLVDHNLSTIYRAHSNPAGVGYYDGAVKIEILGSDSGALWYADEVKVDPTGDTTDIASIQCNKSNITYYFVAIG